MVREKHGKREAEFWEHIEVLEDGRLMCKLCRNKYKTVITRMKCHFAGLKKRGINPCPAVTESVRNAASQAIQASDSSRKKKIVSTSSPKKKPRTFHQPKVAGACKTDKSKANTALVRFLVSNKLPLDVSRTPYLGDLLSSVAEVGHDYKLPTYSELQILDAIAKEKIEEYIGKTKKLFTKTGCTLIISKVEINSKPECLNFFVCSPGGWIYLEKVRIPEERVAHCGFKNNVCRIIKELGPENVVQVILDDSKNGMKRRFTDIRRDNCFSDVIEVIQREYAWIYLSRCATGQVWQILLHICSEVHWICETIQSAKQIFKYICNCNSTLQLLRKQLHPGNKAYSCCEKNKTAIEFFILNSILQIKIELQALGIPMAPASCEGEGLSIENDAAMVVQNPTEFWSNGEKVVQVLQPLFQVLELIDTNESTSGYLNKALTRAEHVFKQHLDVKDWIEVARDLRSPLVQPIHEVAGFLNPQHDFCDDDKVKRVLDSLKLLVSGTEREDLSKEVQLYSRKDPDLFNKGTMEMLEKLHPRKWWECHGDRYPVLQKIAVRLLSQTCSTSLWDDITFRQNSFDNESTMNRIMMEKFNLLKSENVKWIDLQRISGLPEYSHEHVKKFLDNINDEVGTPEYRNLNCPLNCGLGTESTVHERNLERQQQLDFTRPLREAGFRNASTPTDRNLKVEPGGLLDLGSRGVDTALGLPQSGGGMSYQFPQIIPFVGNDFNSAPGNLLTEVDTTSSLPHSVGGMSSYQFPQIIPFVGNDFNSAPINLLKEVNTASSFLQSVGGMSSYQFPQIIPFVGNDFNSAPGNLLTEVDTTSSLPHSVGGMSSYQFPQLIPFVGNDFN